MVYLAMRNTPSYISQCSTLHRISCKVQVRYREDLDLVLKGLSLSIKPKSIFS